MKLPNIKTLKSRITIIAVVSMLVVTISDIIANNLVKNDAESRFEQSIIRGKNVLWEKIIFNELNKLELAMPNLTRDRTSLQALYKDDKTTLTENLDTTFNRLSSAGMITSLEIIDTSNNIVFSSDAAFGKTSTSLALDALANTKVTRGIERGDNGNILAHVAFPLYSSGQLIGAGILSSSLGEIVEDFKINDRSEVFIVSENNLQEYGTNQEMLSQLNLDLPPLGEQSVKTVHVDNKVFIVSIQPVFDHIGKPVAHMISASDTTDAFEAQHRIQYIAYAAIVVGIMAAGLFLLLYMRKSFRPVDNLLYTVGELAKGNIEARTTITSNDEIGQLGTAFNSMAQTMQDTLERERNEKEELHGQIEIILDVVSKAEIGDLTGEMMDFSSEGAISDLAHGVERMLGSLNELVTQVQNSGIQVTSSATQIAATAKQQETTVSEQAASTSEVMATAKQISATSQELVNTIEEVHNVFETTASSATESQTALSRMESTMGTMKEATDSITSKLAVLSEKASNINNVVTTITKVADQTNLLSLNAAIEAEKAGEYGVGFAVVATEIRRLADQTAVATWDIEQMVKEMQSSVSAGVMGMDKFSEEVGRGVEEVQQVSVLMIKIIGQVRALTPRFEMVSEGMHSQSQGAQHISEGMTQLNETAQQTAESLRSSSRSIHQLKDAAQGLQSGVSRFKVNAA